MALVARHHLYFDEDAMNHAIPEGMRDRGYDVLTASEAGLIRVSDQDHLVFAAGRGRILLSYNIRDYHRIHGEWMRDGRAHAGTILTSQRKFDVRQQIGQFAALLESQDDFVNLLAFV